MITSEHFEHRRLQNTERHRLERRIDAVIDYTAKTGDYEPIVVSVTGWSKQAVDAMLTAYTAAGWLVAFYENYQGQQYLNALVLERAP